jgi:pimeloyl-ACP methyl ester carboxylesterase
MNLYFISGLGADERIFGKLKLPDHFTIHHIHWITVSENESVKDYCSRLSDQIDQSSPFTLVGVSFGGIIAIELSRILKPLQTIIISSFCFKQEVPSVYIYMSKIRFHRLPTEILLRPNKFIFWLFGVKNADEKELLSNILKDTDRNFFRWAINQLFTWDNTWKPEGLIHIHGKSDKILPYKKIMDAIPVEDGEHLMVYSKAEIVSQILVDNLSLTAEV